MESDSHAKGFSQQIKSNAESFVLMLLCFVLFGHKCFITNGEQAVQALVNKVKFKKRKEKKTVCVMSHYHAKLSQAKFKRKKLPPFLIMISI